MLITRIQKDQFEPGVNYLKATLKNGIPVMAGVDDGKATVNYDLTTEHFITIVGMGEDTTGNFFSFYDNATGNANAGTSTYNKLYCKPSEYKIEGKGDPGIEYLYASSKKRYLISQIRETK